MRAGASAAAPEALPIFQAKLVPARAGPEPLVRQRLLDELDRTSPLALTLVDAPVGYGKTLLVQTWVARSESAFAWLSLEEADNDSSRLWSYVASSIDRIRSGLGRGAMSRLRSPGAATETVVDELLRAVEAYADPLTFVLDDLHLVKDQTCLDSLEYALVNLPSNARVVATTRSDPALPLARLRARGTLGEIRARQLAFTLEEARQLLVDREGIALDERQLALLVDRTEGWPAGLYLAALWLRELDDPGAGVQAFHGDHRHVADYLTGEVLDTLDADTRRFLLETSTFGRFTSRLCDEILGRSDSRRRLRELERSNGFLIVLDAQSEWYRYHHLFRELLQLELATVAPDTPAAIHLGASKWFELHGLVEEALEHASDAGDPALVAGILVAEHRTLVRSGRLTTILRWCDLLPDELLVEFPELPLAGAMASGLLGRSQASRHGFTALAERARAERPDAWTPYHEALLGVALGTWVERDLPEAIEIATRTVAIARAVPEITAPALANLGYFLYLAGDLAQADHHAAEALDLPDSAGRPHARALALATRSLVASESDHAEDAERTARDALAVATEAAIEHSAVGGAARVALAVSLARRGKLRDAERQAVQGERLRHQPEPEIAHLHALLVLAGIRIRRGRLEDAADDLAHVRRGLAAFSNAGRLPELFAALEAAALDARKRAGALSEPPSAAEASVLRLLATDLTQREIGAELFLSLNTVKTHTRSLYRKLGVTSREAAVQRALALGLLDPDDSPG